MDTLTIRKLWWEGTTLHIETGCGKHLAFADVSPFAISAEYTNANGYPCDNMTFTDAALVYDKVESR